MPRRKGQFQIETHKRVRRGTRTRGLEEEHEAVRLLEVVLEQVQAGLREAILRLVHARLVKPEIRLVQAEQSQPALAPGGFDSCQTKRCECWDQQVDEGRPDVQEKDQHAHSA